MTDINDLCADAGTPNCPCPLAETGDCLICGRLSGKDCCECRWAGVCIYNEYIQNDRVVRNRRENKKSPVIKKIWYGKDLMVLALGVSRGFAIRAARPGAFVFLKRNGDSDFFNVPVSVMRSDAENGIIWLALKVISAKTKRIADEDASLTVRGVYRNGLLGKGRSCLEDDVRLPAAGGKSGAVKTWLIMTKGAGFAPAVSLLSWADGRVRAHVITDTEKVNGEIVRDHLQEPWDGKGGGESVTFESCPLAEAADSGRFKAEDYDRVIILASDYYIRSISEKLGAAGEKLVFSNNFHMCCGEGICGACTHTDSRGNVSRMCKCGTVDVRELI